MKKAGLSQIDYLVVSHFDGDHIGDVPPLAARIPIRHLVDHGDIRFPPQPGGGAPPPRPPSSGSTHMRRSARPSITGWFKPGDTIPAERRHCRRGDRRRRTDLARPPKSAKGAGAANPLCATHPQQPIIERDVEDNQSIGLLFTFGNFRMLDLADLEAHRSHELVCPINLIGQVDVYHVNVHGQFKGMAAELVGVYQAGCRNHGERPAQRRGSGDMAGVARGARTAGYLADALTRNTVRRRPIRRQTSSRICRGRPTIISSSSYPCRRTAPIPSPTRETVSARRIALLRRRCCACAALRRAACVGRRTAGRREESHGETHGFLSPALKRHLKSSGDHERCRSCGAHIDYCPGC